MEGIFIIINVKNTSLYIRIYTHTHFFFLKNMYGWLIRTNAVLWSKTECTYCLQPGRYFHRVRSVLGYSPGLIRTPGLSCQP